MSVALSQPEIRFNLAGPFALQGLSFVPKVITVEKNCTAAGNFDFWTCPAGTYIKSAFAYVETTVTGTAPTFTFGDDGAAGCFITTTDFDVTTAGNWATSLGSTTATNAEGKFYPAGDTMRIVLGGTPTGGKVRLVIEYFEVGAMFNRGTHFSV